MGIDEVHSPAALSQACIFHPLAFVHLLSEPGMVMHATVYPRWFEEHEKESRTMRYHGTQDNLCHYSKRSHEQWTRIRKTQSTHPYPLDHAATQQSRSV